MPNIASSRTIHIRTIIVTLTPALVLSVFMTWFLSSYLHTRLVGEANRFGNTIADQLVITATDSLVNQDVLSLNIMLRDLLAQDNFEFAAVYDTESNLLAQAGKTTDSHLVFTREITFQNTLVGHLRLGLKSSYTPIVELIAMAVLLFTVIAIFSTLAIWFYGDLFYRWMLGSPESRSMDTNVAEQPLTESSCWLTIKLKPDRLVDAHREKLTQAFLLYSGNAQTRGDDITVIFSTGAHIQNSLCCALLIKAITDLLPGNISFKAGLDMGADEDAAPKHAAYLASISEHQLLVSRRVFQQHQGFEGIQLTELHHSAVGEGEVYLVTASNELIKQQAIHLVGPGVHRV